MQGSGLVCFAVHISLFSACFGAAVDAPKTSTDSTLSQVTQVQELQKEKDMTSKKEGQRFPRSVPAEDSVLNFLPINSLDFDKLNSRVETSDSLSDDGISGSLRRTADTETYLRQWQHNKLPADSLSLPKTSKLSSWQLEPQVGKRGKRVRGQSFYRRDSPEVKMLANSLDEVGTGAATTMLSRQQRNGRRYDVPQIECPRSPDHMERFACPRPDRRGRFRCIDDRALCDGFYDCPDKEDENPDHCLFYKTTKAHLDILAEALLRWARGR